MSDLAVSFEVIEKSVQTLNYLSPNTIQQPPTTTTQPPTPITPYLDGLLARLQVHTPLS